MRDKRSMLNFVVLIVVAIGATIFVLKKADQAVAEATAIANAPIYIAEREIHREGTTSGSSTSDAAGFTTYRNEKYRFQVTYPADWHQWYADNSTSQDSPWFFANALEQEKVQGLGLPPSGAMWFDVSRDTCGGPTNAFRPQDYGGGAVTLEKTVCANGFQLTFGLWDSDAKKAAHEKILNAIEKTFQSLKPLPI